MIVTDEQPNSDVRMWAMICHLAGLAGFLPVLPAFGSMIAPLIVWQIKKDEHPFIDEQGKEALNFQLTIGLYAVVGVIVCLVTCVGAFLIPVVLGILYLIDLIFLIIGAVAANNGGHYRYPMNIRFIK
jgi:uncharacterized Tic20 family protein